MFRFEMLCVAMVLRYNVLPFNCILFIRTDLCPISLIALMIVKFRMTVDECIDKYNKLSEEIFGRPHVIGKHTGGFGKPRYSGKRLRKFCLHGSLSD